MRWHCETVRFAQNAIIVSRYDFVVMFTCGFTPAAAVSMFQYGMKSEGIPTHTPDRLTFGPPPKNVVMRYDQMLSGSPACHVCHAVSILPKSVKAMSAEKFVRFCVGCVLKVNDVTTPKFPPPPPRIAQKRSGSVMASHVSMRPSAVTTCAETSASHVRPHILSTTPMPPPCVSPEMPTLRQVPSGMATLRAMV
jgi:hypothetical protein